MLLDLAIQSFSLFVQASTRKVAYLSFLNWEEESEGFYYMKFTIFGLELKAEYEEYILPLLHKTKLFLEDIDTSLAREVHSHIEIDVFQSKKNLMDRFDNIVTNFSKELETLLSI